MGHAVKETHLHMKPKPKCFLASPPLPATHLGQVLLLLGLVAVTHQLVDTEV